MSRSARLAALSRAAIVLAGAAPSVQARDKTRASVKAVPVDEKSAGIDEALRISGIRTHLMFIRSHMKQMLDEDARLDYDARRWLAQRGAKPGQLNTSRGHPTGRAPPQW